MFTRTPLHLTAPSQNGWLNSRTQNVALKIHSEVVAELGISKSRVHDIMNNHLGMSKVCTRWVPKLLTRLQRINRVECCQDLLQQSEADPAKFLDRIVTGDESWIYRYDPLTQQEAKV